MKKLSLLIMALLFSTAVIFAQPQPVWVTTGGGSSSDYGYAATVGANGNSYVTGKFKSSSFELGNGVTIAADYGNYDIYVAAYDSSGQALWGTVAGGPSADEGDAIAVDGDYVYVAGAFFKDAVFGTDTLHSYDNWDVFIAKINALTGEFVWVKQASSTNQAKGQAITIDADHNIIVGGYFGSKNTIDTLWYGGNSFVSGGQRNGFLLKITPDGALVWAKILGGGGYTYVNAITSDESNNIYVCGSYKTAAAEFDGLVAPYVDGYEAYVAKYSDAGAAAWVYVINGPDDEGLFGIDYASNVVAYTGYVKDTAYVGEDTTVWSSGRKDLVLGALNAADGSYAGVTVVGGEEGDERGYTVKIISDGAVFAGGYEESDFMIGSGSDIDNIANAGKKDAFIVAIDPEGHLHGGNFGGNSDDYCKAINENPEGNIYLFGYFKSNPAIFPPNTQVSNHGSYDIWLMRMDVESEPTEATVTFECDMNIKMLEGTFDPNASHVYVRGSFNGWSTDNEMTDGDGDGVYTAHVGGLIPGGVLYFKYFYDNPDTWEGDPNREYIVPDGGGYYYDFFDRDSVANLNKHAITFQVDMSVKQQEGTFDPTASHVYVRGSFNGWGQTEMADQGNYLYQSPPMDLSEGDVVYFKFFYDNPDTWEGDPNREYVVPDHDAIAGPYWFDRDSVVNITGNGNILFTVDMSVMQEVGIFDAATDSVQLRGGFNGWSDSDPARSHMVQNPLIPTMYTINVPFENQPVGDILEYKYYVNLANPGIWTDGWERPSDHGGGNRQIEFEASPDQTTGQEYFADVHPCQVIPAGQTVTITFNVDMTPAMDSTLQAVPFNPATDTLYWIGEQPSFVRTQNWEDTDDMRVLKLTDPDGDGVYSATLSVIGPSFNSFVYRYGYVSASDGSFIHEPAGFGQFAYRTRYIPQTGPRAFVQPYSAPQDVWTNQEDKSNQWEPNPCENSVRNTGEIVKTFSLQQNYPNPFNPTTKIRFSIPSKEMVTLKVFNVLGQEVMTLVNQEMSAGSYEVDFNASNLPTGVYIYKITAGKYSATKKMMLLK